MDGCIYNNLLQIVKGYWRKTNLESRYTLKRYGVPTDSCPVSENLKTDINSCNTNLAKNLTLKKRLCKEMGGGVDNKDINFWIIRKWGGISMAPTDENQAKIVEFYRTLNKNHEANQIAIASFSKVVSFAAPNRYFVYDSRVAYSINWSLREAGAMTGFFPFPKGRSKLATQCKLEDVLCQENRKSCNPLTAYYEYCQLVLRLYNDICPGGKEPYKLEMLLFQIASIEIYDAFRNEFQRTEYYCEDSPSKNRKEGLRQDVEFNGCNIKGRCVKYGILTRIAGHLLYLFVGQSSKKIFCELLFKDNAQQEYPLQDQLISEGFISKGGKTPYLVHYYPKDQEETVRQVFEQVKNRLMQLQR